MTASIIAAWRPITDSTSPYILRELTIMKMTKALSDCVSLHQPKYRMLAYAVARISLADVERFDCDAYQRAIWHRDLFGEPTVELRRVS
jgi:hypothetical protein